MADMICHEVYELLISILIKYYVLSDIKIRGEAKYL